MQLVPFSVQSYCKFQKQIIFFFLNLSFDPLNFIRRLHKVPMELIVIHEVSHAANLVYNERKLRITAKNCVDVAKSEATPNEADCNLAICT
jgi:hypothetical protein